MQVLEYICEGLSNSEISTTLQIKQATVKQHVMNAYAKLGARSRSELIIIALRLGMVVPSWMAAQSNRLPQPQRLVSHSFGQVYAGRE
jgi:DNA-binding CsgD family transcriptional regulator